MNTKQPIKGLTLLQPWDTAFIQWGKPLENRKWKPASFPMGGYIALHRGKGYDLQGAQWLIAHREALGLAPDTIIPAQQKESGIIAVCRLTEVVTESPSPWFFGPYGWCLADIVPIPLVPCVGALSLWELPPDVLEAVRKAYAQQGEKQREREIKVRIARLGHARASVVAQIGPYERGQSRDAKGNMKCPICPNGILYYARAAYNGHLSAHCTTIGCINFRE